jgi:SAM-dependent methyltransferase
MAAPAVSEPVRSACRFCGRPLEHVVADLGMSPMANAFLRPDQVSAMEPFYPLRALVCDACFLVQLEEFETPQAIFGDYAYFSSYSSTWLEHARGYVEQVVERLSLDRSSRVVEIASNDGYLLQYFHEREIPVLGIEPAANVAKVALQKGIPTLVEFFGVKTAEDLASSWRADLLLGNNVLAHVPDLNDFVAGMKVLLAPEGVITMEFPHLERLMEENEFDTIYHEHFSYFSWVTVQRVFAEHGLTLFDVEELPTHGGSLRIWGRHAEDESKPVTDAAQALTERERAAGFESLDAYARFSDGVRESKREMLDFLIKLKREGKRIAGYGAPAKGNTLLNYCGIGTDFLDFTVDISPHKQGCFLPGTHIPIRAPEAIREERPDVVFILPWNLRDEIVEQHAYIREWGGQFAVRVPRLELI